MTIIECLDEMDRLGQQAHRTRIQPEDFAAGIHNAMQKVLALLANQTTEFQDADAILTRTISEYERNPDLAGVGRIRNALVSYRRTATP